MVKGTTLVADGVLGSLQGYFQVDLQIMGAKKVGLVLQAKWKENYFSYKEIISKGLKKLIHK